jgi:EAL domain-containing protein (putative c-di-GMP-specific phosphodiesterase class I)
MQGIVLEQFSLNISVRQLIHHGFIDMVKRLCAEHLDEQLPHQLIFEITETVVSEDMERVIAVMGELRKLGIRFSMDDFGTGYSSLSYLKRLPIDELKIDRTFVQDLDTDEDNQAMVITILSIARFFGLSVVAEGVESTEQFDFLSGYRCELFQGLHFSPPLSGSEFERYYRSAQAGRP